MEKFISTKCNVNFRNAPQVVAGNVIKTLPTGTVLQVLKDVDGTTFSYAELSDGTVGYITNLSQYVEEVTPDWLAKAKAIITMIEGYMNRKDADGNVVNTPYVFGSDRTTDVSFDCSDLMQWCYKRAAGITLPWDSRAQSQAGQPVDLANLRTGDLLFFDTNGDGIVNHVGMYVDKDTILHTNSPKTMINYASFAPGLYWRKHITGARRVIL